jgi:hypothetical protein
LEDIDSAGIVREDMKDGKKKDPTSISLADLLNAIDGAAGVEGIVLIMTTNEPEKLDAALVRPGRIDRKVYFGEIGKSVAKSIFLRMYHDDEALNRGQEAVDDRLKSLAMAFAARIPEDKLTPAEVQTFLTFHADAQEALDHVDQWVEDTLAAKADNKNISGGGSKLKEAGPMKHDACKEDSFGNHSDGADPYDENGMPDTETWPDNMSVPSWCPDPRNSPPLESPPDSPCGQPPSEASMGSRASSNQSSTHSSSSGDSLFEYWLYPLNSAENCADNHKRACDVCVWCREYRDRRITVRSGECCQNCGWYRDPDRDPGP